MKIANKKAWLKVQSQEPFKGSNLHATNENGLYIVWSYNWAPLYVHDEREGLWYENKTKYSYSTSRQKSQCFQRVIDTVLMSHDEIKALIDKKRTINSLQIA